MSLIKKLHEEMNRVRELITEYEKIREGYLGAQVMKADIALAEEAIGEGDMAKMLVSLKRLQDCTG